MFSLLTRHPRLAVLIAGLASATGDELTEFHENWRAAARALAAHGWIASSEQPAAAEEFV